MRFISGTITVGTSGTEEQLSTDSTIDNNDDVLDIVFKARIGNTGNAYIRETTNASAAVGWELQPGESSPTAPFRDFGGSVKASTFYVDVATSGDIVDFWAIVA